MAYDPAFGYEIGAHRPGRPAAHVRRRSPENVFYYLTVYNEPYVQPAEPEDVDVEGILRGIYRVSAAGVPDGVDRPRAQILASGVAVPWALEAQTPARRATGASRPTSGR